MRRWLADQFRTFTAIARWWQASLTTAGKLITFLIVVTLPALFVNDSPLLMVFWTATSLLLAAAVCMRVLRPRLSSRIVAPHSVTSGQRTELTVLVTNRGGITARDLHIELANCPPAWQVLDQSRRIAGLSPGQSQSVQFAVQPTRRGKYPLPTVRIGSGFPLHLVCWNEKFSGNEHLIVLPRWRPLAAFSTRFGATGLEGHQHVLHQDGRGHDYSGSREYVPGVPVRRWDYGSWARLARPVVREFDDPGRPASGILLDTWAGSARRLAPAEPSARFEAAVSLAAAMSDALNHRGLDTFLLAGPEDDSSGSDHPAADHEQVLYTLAGVETDSQDGFAQLPQVFKALPARPAHVFVLLLNWDEVRSRVCRQLAALTNSVTVVHVGSESHGGEPKYGLKVTVEQIESGSVAIT